jgi:hypothetical protein
MQSVKMRNGHAPYASTPRASMWNTRACLNRQVGTWLTPGLAGSCHPD